MEYQLSQHSLQDLVVTKLDVESSVVNVVVDPGHHLLLLLHHGGQLAEDAPKLHDGALNSVHGVRPARVVLVLVLIDGGELLRAAHVDHSVSSLRGHVVLHGKHGSRVIALKRKSYIGRHQFLESLPLWLTQARNLSHRRWKTAPP